MSDSLTTALAPVTHLPGIYGVCFGFRCTAPFQQVSEFNISRLGNRFDDFERGARAFIIQDGVRK